MDGSSRRRVIVPPSGAKPASSAANTASSSALGESVRNQVVDAAFDAGEVLRGLYGGEDGGEVGVGEDAALRRDYEEVFGRERVSDVRDREVAGERSFAFGRQVVELGEVAFEHDDVLAGVGRGQVASDIGMGGVDVGAVVGDVHAYESARDYRLAFGRRYRDLGGDDEAFFGRGD